MCGDSGRCDLSIYYGSRFFYNHFTIAAKIICAMQNRNLSFVSLKTSKWPQVLAWIFYGLCLFVGLTLSLDIFYKILIILGMSAYFWWWKRHALGSRVIRVTLLGQQTWLLTMFTGEKVEVSLSQYVKLGGWVLLHFSQAEAGQYSVLITSATVNKDTFRRLLINLNY